MNWLAILRSLLGLCFSLTEYMKNKQLLEAGEARAIAEGLRNANDIIIKVRKARSDAELDFDKRNGVPDDSDPNLRD